MNSKKYLRGKQGNVRQGAQQMKYPSNFFKGKHGKRGAPRKEDPSKILLTENVGFLDTDHYHSSQITQRDIRDAVDISAATKSFDLHLKDFGPYKFRYLENGRHMVLGGRKGHLASFDWVTKNLHCEVNVMESIHDVCFLHNERMFASAQKKWTYIYDSNGVEIHCLKKMNNIVKLEFLPYHYLLCGGSDQGYLSWLDVTLGETIVDFDTKMGSLKIMAQNPWNAVICCGHAKGVLSMWTPNTKEKVASLLCHEHALTDIAFHPAGNYFATASLDRVVKLWDGRMLGRALSGYHMNSVPEYITMSQKSLLAVGMGKVVEVYKNVVKKDKCEVYIRHEANSVISGMQFCPYEDVLGVSTQKGFTSLLVPGSGEPNFDALENNPYRGGAAKRESEVKGVLGKVPIDFITLMPDAAVNVNTGEERKPKIIPKVKNDDIVVRYRLKGKSGSAQKFERKRMVREELLRKAKKLRIIEAANEKKRIRKERIELKKRKSIWDEDATKEPAKVLDRFKPSRKQKENKL